MASKMADTMAWCIRQYIFRNLRARSIATSSRPVARVHTGAIGTLVPDPRDHLSTWNEWARSIAIGCAQSSLSCGCSSGRYRPVINSASVSARLLDLLLPLKAHVRFHTSSIDQSNMKLWSKADTRTLISIWGDTRHRTSSCWQPTDHSPRNYWHLPANRGFVEDSTISGCFPVCEAGATTQKTPGAVCFAHDRIGIAFACVSVALYDFYHAVYQSNALFFDV